MTTCCRSVPGPSRSRGTLLANQFYGHRAKGPVIMPAGHDDPVCVASRLHTAAKAEAARVQDYDEAHISVLDAAR